MSILLWKAIVVAGVVLNGPEADRGDTLRILLLRPAAASGREVRLAALGVQLGVEEADRTGTMFGRRVVLVTVRNLPEDSGVVLAGLGADGCRDLASLAARSGVLVLNIGCRSDSLRSPQGSRLFHVAAGGWGPDGSASPPPALWLPTLSRFGAEQLNQRFFSRFGEPMTGDAWAGWVAVKIALEASLRARTIDPVALAAALAAPGMKFDGHKGRALSFRASDHQLLQPLYVTGGDGETHEVNP